MHIEERVLPGGHVIFRPVGETCDICGEEKVNIMCYGEVCINHCDEKDAKESKVIIEHRP